MGVRYNGYCSDITRTFCLRPDSKKKKISENVSFIQQEIIDSIKEGLSFDYVEKIYENLMKKNSYSVFHSFGHGVGLSPHERPVKKDILRNGMILTVEPGVYIKNLGGYRIEDMIVIKNGKAKVISNL